MLFHFVWVLSQDLLGEVTDPLHLSELKQKLCYVLGASIDENGLENNLTKTIVTQRNSNQIGKEIKNNFRQKKLLVKNFMKIFSLVVVNGTVIQFCIPPNTTVI